MYAKGVSAAIVSVHRNSPQAIDPAIKSGNYLNNVLALGEARRRSGAYEAILCAADGRSRKALPATSSLSPAGKCDPGAGRRHPGRHHPIEFLELCRAHGVPLRETRFTPDDVRAADEVFITSATRGTLPVTTVDGEPIVGSGNPDR